MTNPRLSPVICMGLSLGVHASLAFGALSPHTRAAHEQPKSVVWLRTELARTQAPPTPLLTAAAPLKHTQPDDKLESAPHAPLSTPRKVARAHRGPSARPSKPKLPTARTTQDPERGVEPQTHELDISDTQTRDSSAREPAAAETQPEDAAEQAPPSATHDTAATAPSLQPAVIRQVQPEYPAAAKRARITGVVRVEVRIDAQGRVVLPLRILTSIPELDAAALAAVQQWVFAPARDEHGVPVPSIVQIPLRFVLR